MIRGGFYTLGALAVFVGACSSQAPQTTVAPAAESVAKPTPPDAMATSLSEDNAADAMAHCRGAISQALTRVQDSAENTSLSAEDFEIVASRVSDFDFNLDGRIDCVLRYRGRLHDLFTSTDTGYTYLGTVLADKLHSLSCVPEVHKGHCVVYASEQMIHGETLSRSYAYDGTRYEVASSRMSKPHPKFGP